MALMPLVKGLAFGIVGFILGAGTTVLVAIGLGRPAAVTEGAISLGYLVGLAGWLLGVGVWDYWARGWFGLPLRTFTARGWRRYFAFSTDHKVIGVQYLVTFLVLFMLAGFFAMLMRIELASPGQTIMTAGRYTHVMSMHGISMIAVSVAVIIGGLGNFAVPLLIGADDMAFPRLNALSYWLVPPVAVLLVATFFTGGFDTGWTAYPPLSVVNATGQLLFNLAVITFGLSSILGGLNFLVTITRLRAPGMTWGRLPVFVWSVFAASIISLTATQFLAAALLMVLLDRTAGTAFFDAARGGAPLLYQHVFWFYSHPAVYIMILPAFGIVLEVLTHFSRKPLYAYRWVVGGFLGLVAVSFLVWAHHQYTSGMPDFLHGPFMATTEVVSIPTGLVFLSALGTIWMGRLWLRTPMLFALGFLFNFLIGGITGIFNADVPTDLHLQDTYFVVSHFHYTLMGSMIFGLLAGIYYWFPKITGRMYDERLGRLHFWWTFLTFNTTFIPMFWLGLFGMNRRIADYPAQLGPVNLFISVSAFLLGASFLIFVYNMIRSWVRGPQAGSNPWRARTLEWQVPSPPHERNFPSPPRVTGHPYDYGVPGAVHAMVAVTGGAGPTLHQEDEC